jgi:DNA-directed RNA polymerase sigma subunit (sigma70/sigma32)
MSDDDSKLDDELRAMIDALTDREWEVLRDRFGIDRESATDEEVLSKLFEITREKIQAIEKKARRKLERDDGPNDAA